MEVHPLSNYSQEAIDRLLMAVPFYKQVSQKDKEQFNLLKTHSRILSFAPGETVLNKGDKDKWMCFLLKGQLRVVVGEGDHCKEVNIITPGEVFGDLAILFGEERTATVVSDINSRQILVLGTDFEVLGALENVQVISLDTKIIYYRNMVHNLRWKLEMYRAQYPGHQYASMHHKVKLYHGKKDTMEELQALDQQARALALLLIKWNSEFNEQFVKLANAIDSESLEQISQ